MNLRVQKICIFLTLLLSSLSMIATHYINHTGKTIVVTNVTAKKRTKKSYFSYFSKKNVVQPASPEIIKFIEIENDQEGDLDNNQDDEITITSPGMSDKRKLFPTNNSFNYVITLNNYKSMFEKFDINRAGNDDEMNPHKIKQKKVKKAKVAADKKAAAEKKAADKKAKSDKKAADKKALADKKKK